MTTDEILQVTQEFKRKLEAKDAEIAALKTLLDRYVAESLLHRHELFRMHCDREYTLN